MLNTPEWPPLFGSGYPPGAGGPGEPKLLGVATATPALLSV